MVSGGPGVGLRELTDETAGLLLRPTASEVGDRRRPSTGSATAVGNRKRSTASMSSLSPAGWKLKYQDFVPDTKKDGIDWDSAESFS